VPLFTPRCSLQNAHQRYLFDGDCSRVTALIVQINGFVIDRRNNAMRRASVVFELYFVANFERGEHHRDRVFLLLGPPLGILALLAFMLTDFCNPRIEPSTMNGDPMEDIDRIEFDATFLAGDPPCIAIDIAALVVLASVFVMRARLRIHQQRWMVGILPRLKGDDCRPVGLIRH
jgi:hypothetical protein